MESENLVRLAAYADERQIVELAWNQKKQQPDFIVFDRESGKNTRACSPKTALGEITAPQGWRSVVTPDANIPGTVFVPTECKKPQSDGTRLRAGITAFINRYIQLAVQDIPLVVEYVLLTWVHDAFDELPYLAFRAADCGSGKSRALETIGALCYRPLIVGGGSTAAATLRLLDSTVIPPRSKWAFGQKSMERRDHRGV